MDEDLNNGNILTQLIYQSGRLKEYEMLMKLSQSFPGQIVFSSSFSKELNVNSLQQEEAPVEVKLNDIVRVTIKTASVFVFDRYKEIRNTGGAILIDETSNLTVAAFMIQ